ncbi:uncharacterized protein DDB_G0279979-like [Ischnura elegans]|uniref:uncharacterized protein DDB_G0279979-like n=1 Tax=Ischnura elegans TaxID=197161 RepID=UPI001ED87629|nr:uncharacterized protein DDB_G0279979-like [Ischnura elegans]
MAEKSQREERFMLNRNIVDLTGLAIMEEVERDAESPVGQTESTIESIYQTPIALNPVRELLEEMRREREKEKEEMRERELLREKEKQERRREKEREKEELRKERQSLQSEFLKMMGAVNNRISQQESTLVEVKEVTINLGERMNRIEGEVEVTREQIRESTKTKFEVLKGRLERLEQQGPTSKVTGGPVRMCEVCGCCFRVAGSGSVRNCLSGDLSGSMTALAGVPALAAGPSDYIGELANIHYWESDSSELSSEDEECIVGSDSESSKSRVEMEVPEAQGRNSENDSDSDGETKENQPTTPDGTVWLKADTGTFLLGRKTQHNVLWEKAGPTSYAKIHVSGERVASAWRMFIDNSIFLHIHKSTEAEADRVLQGNSWSISIPELEASIEILYASGSLKNTEAVPGIRKLKISGDQTEPSGRSQKPSGSRDVTSLPSSPKTNPPLQTKKKLTTLPPC